MLKTENSKNGKWSLSVFDSSEACENHNNLHDAHEWPDHFYSWEFEHGQLWIHCQCGAAWSVVDTNDGFDFEQVSEGDVENA